MAFTSIAATLLSIEKRFKRHLLILLFANSSSSKKTNIFIWDKAPISLCFRDYELNVA